MLPRSHGLACSPHPAGGSATLQKRCKAQRSAGAASCPRPANQWQAPVLLCKQGCNCTWRQPWAASTPGACPIVKGLLPQQKGLLPGSHCRACPLLGCAAWGGPPIPRHLMQGSLHGRQSAAQRPGNVSGRVRNNTDGGLCTADTWIMRPWQARAQPLCRCMSAGSHARAHGRAAVQTRGLAADAGHVRSHGHAAAHAGNPAVDIGPLPPPRRRPRRWPGTNPTRVSHRSGVPCTRQHHSCAACTPARRALTWPCRRPR